MAYWQSFSRLQQRHLSPAAATWLLLDSAYSLSLFFPAWLYSVNPLGKSQLLYSLMNKNNTYTKGQHQRCDIPLGQFSLFLGTFSLDDTTFLFRCLLCPVVFRFLSWMPSFSWKTKTKSCLNPNFRKFPFLASYNWSNERHLLVL